MMKKDKPLTEQRKPPPQPAQKQQPNAPSGSYLWLKSDGAQKPRNK